MRDKKNACTQQGKFTAQQKRAQESPVVCNEIDDKL